VKISGDSPKTAYTGAVRDVMVIAIVVAFFAVAAGYVAWCERIVSADAAERPETAVPDAAAAPGAELLGSPDRAASMADSLSGGRR